MMREKFGAFAVARLLVLFLLALLFYAVWRTVSLHVSPNATRAWALVATALIPLAAWLGHHFGTLETRSTLHGLDTGVDRVVGAATRVADVKVSAARAMRQAEPAWEVDLPEPQARPRLLTVAGESEIVEL